MQLINPPTTISGKNVNTDFRYWMEIAHALEDDDILINEKVSVIVRRVFGAVPDTDDAAYELFEQCINFYNCGKERREVPSPPEKLLDWTYDSMTIWADFMVYLHIDLDELTYMHWWRFKALFESLPPDSHIKTLIAIRSEDLSDYSGKEMAKTRERKRQEKLLAAIHPGTDDYYD